MTGLTYGVFKNDNRKDDISFNLSEKNGIICIDITTDKNKGIDLKNLGIYVEYPVKGAYLRWSPNDNTAKGITHNWYKDTYFSLASYAPINTYIGKNDENIFTVAFSDAMNNTAFSNGLTEETGRIRVNIKLFPNEKKIVKGYSETIYIVTEKIPYYDAIEKIVKKWEERYKPAFVPDDAKKPMYSTWYSYHQHLYTDEIVKECELAKKSGCEAVIVDDGWQTGDNKRGYAYCGDWEVFEGKIPSMKDFVDKIHNIGMKFLLWYSVPFVGKYSKAYDEFEGMYLDDDGDWRVFDPRFPKVREHIVETYKKALKAWNLDGFKLDFIDCFFRDTYITREYEYDSRRDYESIPEAILALMTDVMSELKKIKKDVLIEFRQRYIGPVMRTFGNMLRAGDCPCDSYRNKVSTVNLRLTSGNSAVHSDMIMFDENETAHGAALQFIDTLFSVPQVSVKYEKISDDIKKMIHFYLDFWTKNQNVLLDGKFMPEYAECGFGIVSSQNKQKCIKVVYQPLYAKLNDDLDENVVINATGKDYVVIDTNLKWNITVKDCMGNILQNENNGIKFSVPPSGMIIFTK